MYPEWAVAMLMEMCFPFSLAAYLLFTLYWHEMMTNATVIVHPFITKMKIPFFVLSGLLISLQVIRIIIRSVTTLEFNFNIVTGTVERHPLIPATINPFIVASVYMVVLVGLVIFYAITGGKILKRLSSSKKLGRTVQLGRVSDGARARDLCIGLTLLVDHPKNSRWRRVLVVLDGGRNPVRQRCRLSTNRYVVRIVFLE